MSNPLVDSVMLYNNSFLEKINVYLKGLFSWSEIEKIKNKGKKTDFMNI